MFDGVLNMPLPNTKKRIYQVYFQLILSQERKTSIVVSTCGLKKQPPGVFYKKGVIKNFAKFTGKHMCQSLFSTLI